MQSLKSSVSGKVFFSFVCLFFGGEHGKRGSAMALASLAEELELVLAAAPGVSTSRLVPVEICGFGLGVFSHVRLVSRSMRSSNFGSSCLVVLPARATITSKLEEELFPLPCLGLLQVRLILILVSAVMHQLLPPAPFRVLDHCFTTSRSFTSFLVFP